MSDLYPLESYYLPKGDLPGGGGGGGGGGSYTRNDRTEGDLYAGRGTLANVVVRGRMKVLESGAIASGQTAFNTGTGYWIEANRGTPRMSIGNPLGDHMTWDGAGLSLVGGLTATTGTVGGWTVGTTTLAGGSATLDSAGNLALGTGNQLVKLDAQDATYRLWVGNSVPASAPFSVDKAGAIKSTSGQIAAWNLGASAFTSGSGASTVGLDSGGTNPAIYAGSATPGAAPFRVTQAGAVTASNVNVTGGTVSADTIKAGTLVFGSSGTVNTTGSVSGTFGGLNVANLTITGTLTLGTGGKIVDADGSEWSQTGIILKSSGVFGDAIKWQTSGVDKASIYTAASLALFEYSGGSFVSLSQRVAALTGQPASGAAPSFEADGTNGWTRTYGKFYPGNGQGNGQGTYYIEGGSGSIITNGIGIGGMLGISSGNTINFISPGVGSGAPSNWSAGSPTGADYFIVQIGGVNRRVPYWANA